MGYRPKITEIAIIIIITTIIIVILGLICRDTDENGILQEVRSIGLSVMESRQIINKCIRSRYHTFCKKGKDWTNPELLTFLSFIFEGGKG